MVAPLRAEKIVVDAATLVGLAKDGDSNAFGELYVRHAPLVRALLLAHAPPDDVPDLAHDTFLIAMKRISDVRNLDAFGPWIASIARNVARAHHRASRETEQLTDDIPGPAVGTDSAI